MLTRCFIVRLLCFWYGFYRLGYCCCCCPANRPQQLDSASTERNWTFWPDRFRCHAWNGSRVFWNQKVLTFKLISHHDISMSENYWLWLCFGNSQCIMLHWVPKINMYMYSRYMSSYSYILRTTCTWFLLFLVLVFNFLLFASFALWSLVSFCCVIN